MTVRDAKYEDMKQLGRIMSVSFKTAFSGYISPQTLEVSANQDSCIMLVESVFREGKIHFLIGEEGGMLCWQEEEAGVEMVAIHSLPETWGTGLGHAMLTKALCQIGEKPVFLWVFKENHRARRFYEKHGFHWDGTERVSEYDGAPEVRYVKG